MLPLYPSDSVTNQIINDLPQVNSSQEAKAQLTRPSTRDVLWDRDSNYFYMRITDAAGKITSFERYEYNPSPEPKMEDLFVSNESFYEVTNRLEGGINDVKESIQQLISAQQSKQYERKPNNSNGKGNNQSSQSR